MSVGPDQECVVVISNFDIQCKNESACIFIVGSQKWTGHRCVIPYKNCKNLYVFNIFEVYNN